MSAEARAGGKTAASLHIPAGWIPYWLPWARPQHLLPLAKAKWVWIRLGHVAALVQAHMRARSYRWARQGWAVAPTGNG